MKKMIKECPMCGSKKLFVYDDGWDCFVQCVKCGCHGGTRKTKQKAIQAWNTRPREEELLGVIKQVQKVIDLSSSDDDALEWLKANDELLKVVEETIKKYEVENE